KMHGGWRPEYREAWIKLINRYNVKAVIAGHFHRAEQHWLGDVPLYVAPPVAGYWGRQASYRLYHYQAGRLSFTTQYLDR
ncbi:MAG: metallophosphoesterase family protein, partial [Candidatus Sumerlaeota bacterium]